MGQKDGEKWTAAVDLQPTLPKSDRLLAVAHPCVTPSARHPLEGAMLVARRSHGILG